MKQYIKKLFFGAGIKEKKILFGLAAGINMNIDMANKLQRLLGLDEREVQPAFNRFAKEAGIFVDVGASDGYYGLIYYKINKNGIQYLCDANGAYAGQQRDHFLLNGFLPENVHFISKYVTSFTDDTHVALNDLVKNPAAIIFIKIDVDGGELEVLKGVEHILRQNNCKIIIETHSKELEEDCIAHLQQLNYKCTVIPNAWWRLIIPETRPIPHNRWFKAEKINN